MKIGQVCAELFHADEQAETDSKKLTVAFRNFAHAHIKRYIVLRRYTFLISQY
jgi:hypothetical protein